MIHRRFNAPDQMGSLLNKKSMNKAVHVIRQWSGFISNNEKLLQEAGFNGHGKHVRSQEHVEAAKSRRGTTDAQVRGRDLGITKALVETRRKARQWL